MVILRGTQNFCSCSGCVALFSESSGVFLSHTLQFLPWMLFLAVSEGLAFMLMALGQNYSPPTHAAIILSLGPPKYELHVESIIMSDVHSLILYSPFVICSHYFSTCATEGVFAAVFSFVFLGEQLSNRELVGCVLMLLATYIAKAGIGFLPMTSLSLADCDSHATPMADWPTTDSRGCAGNKYY